MVADLDRYILKVAYQFLAIVATGSVKAVDQQNKNNNNNKMEKWEYF